MGAAFDIGQNEYSPNNRLKLTAYRRSLSRMERYRKKFTDPFHHITADKREIKDFLKFAYRRTSFICEPLACQAVVIPIFLVTRVRPCNIAKTTLYYSNMTRPLRIIFSGTVYYITSRGNSKQKIFLNKRDFADFLNLHFRW